jgi:nickel-dependent lactate racemase
MKSELLYGHGSLTIDLPNEIEMTTVHKNRMVPLEDDRHAIIQALENPVESPFLSAIGGADKTACILICDITRPVPNGKLLPPLIDALTASGVQKQNMTILIATGLHRPNEGEELLEVVGDEDICRSIRVENHFARDKDAHVDLGSTSNGIPVMIDRRFYEADLKIVVGLVEPHFMAGYSGGRKLVAPGVAYQDTILNFHVPRILEHPKSANCVVEGNPLHEIQMEIIATIGQILALNVVIDEERRIGFVNFGEVKASHSKAIDFMRHYAEVSLPRRFKTVVTSSAGYPLDKTYYQTVKGMVGALDILEPGGTIIIASECSEGMGSPEFVTAQRLLYREGAENFMTILNHRDKALIDEWQTEMLVKALNIGKVQLYTQGLNDDELMITCVEPVESLAAAILRNTEFHQDKHIAIIPEGPYVIPKFSVS